MSTKPSHPIIVQQCHITDNRQDNATASGQDMLLHITRKKNRLLLQRSIQCSFEKDLRLHFLKPQ